MCGIAGYAGIHAPETIAKMCEVMIHRGPDDAGVWYDQEAQVGFGHRRLSIIDLSAAGHQPMFSDDGRVVVSYNGEIYNYLELRSYLIGKGYKFRGNSDTEVVLCMYQEHGISFLNMLNGIFAFAIWDANESQLLLARDHCGIKPLYYTKCGPAFYFASEIKALLRVPQVVPTLNRKAIPDFLTFLWVPGESTLFEGIKKLEPGHYLTWKDGGLNIAPWFHLEYRPVYGKSEEEWVKEVRESFLAATQRQMVSDVPLGAFLSGGLDSSSVVACMRNAFPNRDITCYNLAFDQKDIKREGFEDDYPYARKVADHLSVSLKSVQIGPDILELLPKIIYYMDEPDADPTAILTYIVSKMAHDDGTTVLLSGTGGDEIFFGYRSHFAYKTYADLEHYPRSLVLLALKSAEFLAKKACGARSASTRRLNKFKNAFEKEGVNRHLAIVDWSNFETRSSIYSKAFSSELMGMPVIKHCVEKYYDNFIGNGELNRHSHILIQTFLSAHNLLYTDKCAMATSVEIRVPFMDVEVIKHAATIPESFKVKGRTGKYILKKAMEPLLPKDVIYRPKTGFSPPLRQWILGGLSPFIDEYLSYSSVKGRGIFDPDAIQNILYENKCNIADHGYLIYALLTLEIWMQTFIDAKK